MIHHNYSEISERQVGISAEVYHDCIRPPPDQEIDLVIVDTPEKEAHCITDAHGVDTDIFVSESQLVADVVGGKV